MTGTTVGIIGMPGVGKTTLFNRICHNRNITSDLCCTTTDIVYGLGKLHSSWFGSYYVADTSGWELRNSKHNIQLVQLTDEADAIILVLDSRTGVTKGDREIIKHLTKINKSFHVAVNKSDPQDIISQQKISSQKNVTFISASHNIGIGVLLFTTLKAISKISVVIGAKTLETKLIAVAIVGQQNTGKSTLVNAVLRDQRVRTSEEPGTTRDQVTFVFDLGQYQYRIIDTAGYPRRNSTSSDIGRQSVLQSFRAINKASIVVLVTDTRFGLSNRDQNVLSYSDKSKKTTLLVCNKTDLSDYFLGRSIEPRLSHRRSYLVSAIKRRGVNTLVLSVKELTDILYRNIPTVTLGGILRNFVTPSLNQVRCQADVRLSHMHQGGTNPPVFVLHGQNVNSLTRRDAERIANIVRSKLNFGHINIGIRLVEETS